MKIDNLLCIKKQFVPKTTDSKHNLPVYPNLARDLVVIGINQLWAADITDIRLVRGILFIILIREFNMPHGSTLTNSKNMESISV